MKILIKLTPSWVLLFLTIFPSGILSSKTVATLEEFLDDQVTSSFMPNSKSVALGISVIQEGQPIYSKGFGHRDPADPSSNVTSQTFFPIASCSKGFVATMIVKLLNEEFPQYGESIIEMPIKKIFDLIDLNLNVTLIDRYRSESVSFRDLLSHRVCVSSHLNGVCFGAIQNLDDYVFRTRYENELCPFRTAFVYSNAMYSLAGQLIAEIKQDTFENLMRNFLDELGMKNSHLVNLEEDYENVDDIVQGFYADENGILGKYSGKILNQLAVVSPAGGILTTPEEITKYMKLQLNFGKIDNVQIVPQEVMHWIRKTATPVDSTQTYGMGFMLLHQQGGEPIMSHGGYWPPFSSQLTIDLNQRVSIFTSTNGPGSVTPQEEQTQLHSKILEFVSQNNLNSLVVHLPNFFKTILNKNKIVQKTKMAPCSDNDVLGHFGHVQEGELDITTEVDGELKIKFGTLGEGTLRKMEDCTYEIEWTSVVKALMYTAADGLEGPLINTLDVDPELEIVVWNIAGFLGESVIFHRNLTIGNLPQLPYDPSSCVAENFYG